MSIKFINGVFVLETKNTEYQAAPDDLGILKHLWYGAKTGRNMDYIIPMSETAFGPSVGDAGEARDRSLSVAPLEYSSFGMGDFRITPSKILHKDGTCAADFRYCGYNIIPGKYSITDLPHVYADENEAETLEIYMKDLGSQLKLTLRYSVIPELDIITRCAVFENACDSDVILENASSLCLDLPFGDWECVRFSGSWAAERTPLRTPLTQGITEISSLRGTSSHHQNPSLVVCSPDCTESTGRCYGAALVYSGSFKTQLELDALGYTRIVMGINPDTFSWTLSPKDTFETPEVILSYSAEGFEKLSHNFHKVIRNHVCRGKYKLAERPVLINNWEATYFDFDENKLYDIARKASELGVDMFVLDDGWFGKRNDDNSGLGDWFVNENKIKGGLKQLTEKITDLGMKFGIWFEPEMVSEDSDLYRSHPEWAIKIPGRLPSRGRNQLVLDMSREDVRSYLFKVMSDILGNAKISYVKWDMNRSICDLYSAELPPERMGEFSHRYVLGVYDLLERLTSAFPDVLFEGCSGGGGRFDAGMLYYCPQIWCSDNTDAYDRTRIQYGTSFFYPISAVGSHVSAVPNHQTGRVTPIETRAVTAMAGSFGYELDPNKLSDEEKNAVKEQIVRFKKYRSLIHNGLYYRLSNPIDDELAAWAFVSDDKSRCLAHGMVFTQRDGGFEYIIRLRGLDPNKSYRLESDGSIYTGAALTEGGLRIPFNRGSYVPFEFYLTAVE